MTEGKRKGRSLKLQEREMAVVRALVTEYPMSTIAELSALLCARCDISVSLPTLTAAMKRAGIRRVKPSAPTAYVSPPTGPKRYGYADRHRDAGDEQHYSCSLTDAEWALLSDLFERDSGRGKPARYARRWVVDACSYAVRTGCAWRLLPKSFPPWNAVYKLFRRWSEEGRFERMHDRLRSQWRERLKRDARPTTSILDAQSTRTSPQGGLKGFDAGKHVKGRKRHLVVDTLGLLLAVTVTAASVQDRDAAPAVMAQACAKYPSIERLYVDNAYAGQCAENLQQTYEIDVHVVRHPANRNVGQWHNPQLPLFEPPTRAYAPLPKRWIVERTHAWVERARRLVMHHDRLPAVSEAWVWFSQARRLARELTRS